MDGVFVGARHPDPDPIVNCARFGNMEPPGFVRV